MSTEKNLYDCRNLSADIGVKEFKAIDLRFYPEYSAKNHYVIKIVKQKVVFFLPLNRKKWKSILADKFNLIMIMSYHLYRTSGHF